MNPRGRFARESLVPFAFGEREKPSRTVVQAQQGAGYTEQEENPRRVEVVSTGRRSTARSRKVKGLCARGVGNKRIPLAPRQGGRNFFKCLYGGKEDTLISHAAIENDRFHVDFSGIVQGGADSVRPPGEPEEGSHGGGRPSEGQKTLRQNGRRQGTAN